MPSSSDACLAMIAGQLRPNRVNDERLLDAMTHVPRERFVPSALKSVAYVDEDLEIAPGRYLMEPMIFARLVMEANIAPQNSVLDIGCGLGYSTAVLSHLADTVVAVEEDPELANQAERKLRDLDRVNTVVLNGPLSAGAADQSPFDVILLNGAVEEVPVGLINQLKPAGRLACVQQSNGMGRATIITRLDNTISRRECFDAATPLLRGFESTPAFQF